MIAPDYRCVACGDRATTMTSVAGQGQTFYCTAHTPWPADPYDEDGYCAFCGNGRWKYHAPSCKWQDAIDAADVPSRSELPDEGDA